MSNPNTTPTSTVTETSQDLRTALAASESMNALLIEESLDRLELAAEDKDWRVAGLVLEQEFSRQGLTAITRNCQLMTIASPLIKRGVQIRTGYVWGQGVTVQALATSDDDGSQDVNAVLQDFLDDPGNKRAFTSAEAHVQCERTLATDGNWLLAFFPDPTDGRVQVRTLPFGEVIDKFTNPDDREQDWFFLREYTETVIESGYRPGTLRRRKQTRRVFHPALGYRPTVRPSTIDDIPVEWDQPVLHVAVNRPAGWKWGVPDVYAALPWARAYEGFLTDWARLVKALSKFAWRLTGDRASKAQKAADRARATALPVGVPSIGGASDAGQMVGMGPGVNLEAIPKTGATIDSESGRPLAAIVAAALGLSVVELLADPGVTGARAVAETLDKPEVLEMGMRQELWASVIQTVSSYVIEQAVRAPRGPLQGTVTDDGAGRVRIELAGDVETTVEVTFPPIDDLDPKAWVDAIVAAASTEKLPDVWVVKQLLRVLGEQDVDEVVKDMLDDEGNFIDPGIRRAAAAIADQRKQAA